MEEQLIQEVIDLAFQNVMEGKGGPFAAMVVRGGHIIAIATNTVTSTNDPTAHAEVNAIRQACKRRFPSHPHSQCSCRININGRMVTQTTFVGSECVVVLYSIPGKNLNGAVIHFYRKMNNNFIVGYT